MPVQNLGIGEMHLLGSPFDLKNRKSRFLKNDWNIRTLRNIPLKSTTYNVLCFCNVLGFSEH
jgi:hypothetical protein